MLSVIVSLQLVAQYNGYSLSTRGLRIYDASASVLAEINKIPNIENRLVQVGEGISQTDFDNICSKFKWMLKLSIEHSSGEITDLSSLKKVKNIEFLQLKNCADDEPISLAPVAELDSLKELVVVATNIKDYEFVLVDGEESGIVNADTIEVIYYYQKKNAHIIAKYIEEGTNREIAEPIEQDVDYGTYYATTSSGEIADNYEFVRKTDNFEGIAKQDLIEVFYYYRKKDSGLTSRITKLGTEEITSRDEPVMFEINYEANINDYIGPVKVTIVDKLPYKLDTSYQNELDGGVYNEYKNTIEWNEEIDEFNSYDGNQLLISKVITLKYKDIDATERTMVNNVTGRIRLSNNVKEVENSIITRISIPGTIIVHHYIKGTTEELVPDEYNEGLVGETYISHEQSVEGYIIRDEQLLSTNMVSDIILTKTEGTRASRNEVVATYVSKTTS